MRRRLPKLLRSNANAPEAQAASPASAHENKRAAIECRDLAAPLPPEADDVAPPKRPRSTKDLFFKPQPMVRWLRPSVLVGAAKEVAVSNLFARFADKRELQGGLPARWWDASGLAENGSLWLDFASDTGDGFGPTYAVASQLARDRLSMEGEDLPRGKLLVLDGDQVYPSASWEAYRDRFVGPYTAALPHVPVPEHPYLFALPGNHDWYDGLTSFMRLFCQGSWIGGWKTEQTRSYFAIRLPEPWWLWAVDTQFDTYVDGPQLRYFREMTKALGKNEKVERFAAQATRSLPRMCRPCARSSSRSIRTRRRSSSRRSCGLWRPTSVRRRLRGERRPAARGGRGLGYRRRQGARRTPALGRRPRHRNLLRSRRIDHHLRGGE
jgi:hypothetical protein